MAKKKVLILGKLPPPYIGPSIATEIILNSSLKNKFELIHLDTKVNEDLSGFGKMSIGKIFKNFSLYGKMGRLIKKHQPDLVLVPISQTRKGFLKDSVFISIAARNKVKCVIHLRGSEFRNWYEGETNSVKKRVNSTLSKCEGAIVLGEKLKPIFKDIFPENRIFVVPNGGKYHFPKKEFSDKVRVLYFSNLLLAKGVSDLLKAISLLKEDDLKKIECDLVGAWHKEEDKKECGKILMKSKLPVKIHPPVGGIQKWQFFANADIFVFPPRESEGHPWAIVEAMAAGLPVISTDKGAISESVVDGRSGFIVEAENAAQIAEKLRILLRDENLRKKMGEVSREIYLEKFTEEKMVDNLERVFNGVIDS